MVMVRGGSSASFRRSSDDMDDLGRSMHEDEPDRLILDYKLRCAEIYLCCVYSLAPDGSMHHMAWRDGERDLLSLDPLDVALSSDLAYVYRTYRTYVRLRLAVCRRLVSW